MTLLSPGDFIKRMIQVYRAHWGSLLRYVGLMVAFVLLGVILLVASIIATIGMSLVSGPDAAGLRELLTAGSSSVSFVVFFIFFIVIALLSLWLQIAFLRTVSRAVLNHEKISIGAELKNSRPRIWRTLGSGILVGLVTGLPLFIALGGWAITTFSTMAGAGGSATLYNVLRIFFSLLGVYAFFHMIYFSSTMIFATTGVSIDNWGVKESLKKSAEFARGKWWAILGRTLLAAIVVFLPYYVLAGLSQIDGIGVVFAILCVVYYIGAMIPLLMLPGVILYHNIKGDLPAHGTHHHE